MCNSSATSMNFGCKWTIIIRRSKRKSSWNYIRIKQTF